MSIYCTSERRIVCYGVEWDWSDFRFLTGRKWAALLRFHTSFTSATYCSDVAKWWTRDRRDFWFRSRYFQFRPGGKPRAFWVNIRANSYLGPILPRLRGHTRGFGLARPLRSRYFCFRRLSPGADTTIDLLARVQQNPVYPRGKRRLYNNEAREMCNSKFVPSDFLFAEIAK